MLEITDETFDAAVLDATAPVLVDCWAPWCAPCKALVPILEKIEADYAGRATIVKVNLDENQDVAQRFSIMSIPTLLVFKNGKLFDSVVGVVPEGKIKDLLDRAAQ